MLGSRLVDVLARLEMCLAAENLPHFFSPEINLLSRMTPYTMAYVSHKIQHLRNNKDEIARLLQT